MDPEPRRRIIQQSVPLPCRENDFTRSKLSFAPTADAIAKSEPSANRPKIGKERVEQRRSKIGGPGAPAGSLLEADRALHHLHVAIPPFLHTFVKVDKEFTDLPLVWVAAIELKERVLELRPFRGRLRDVALKKRSGHRMPKPGDEARKRVV